MPLEVLKKFLQGLSVFWIMIKIKSAEEINLMRIAGRVTAEVLMIMRENVKPGISTGELDKLAEDHIRKNNGIPAFKNYRPSLSMTPFPGTICASINEEIVHGIPSYDRILQEGDILSVDVGACINGFFGDAACTYPVGEISAERQKLLNATEEALNLFRNNFYKLDENYYKKILCFLNYRQETLYSLFYYYDLYLHLERIFLILLHFQLNHLCHIHL